MNLKIWLWTGGWAVFYCLGEFFSKKWSIAVGRPWLAFWALFFYLTCVCFWLPALKLHGSLTILGCVYAACATLLTIIIGRCIFGEPVCLKHWIGISFALVAIVLLSD